MIRRVLFAVDYYERARVRLTDQIGSILSLLHRSLEPIYVNLRSSTVSLIRVHSCAFAVRFFALSVPSAYGATSLCGYSDFTV